MHALDILGDPVRRRILEILSKGEKSSGDVVSVISKEFGISQPAVSYQLKILRLNGFATVRPEAQLRLYQINTSRFGEIQEWMTSLETFWDSRLDALETEVARGKKKKKKSTR